MGGRGDDCSSHKQRGRVTTNAAGTCQCTLIPLGDKKSAQHTKKRHHDIHYRACFPAHKVSSNSGRKPESFLFPSTRNFPTCEQQPLHVATLPKAPRTLYKDPSSQKPAHPIPVQDPVSGGEWESFSVLHGLELGFGRSVRIVARVSASLLPKNTNMEGSRAAHRINSVVDATAVVRSGQQPKSGSRRRRSSYYIKPGVLLEYLK